MRTPSQNQIDDFKAILEQEILLYQSVEKILTEKQPIIVRGDLEELSKIDMRLENLIQEAKKLEEQRMSSMLGMGRENESFKDFITRIESAHQSESLIQIQGRLMKTTEKVKKLTNSNQDLLTRSIRMIEQSINVIACILSPQGAGYSNPRIKGSQGRFQEGRLQAASGLATTTSWEA